MRVLSSLALLAAGVLPLCGADPTPGIDPEEMIRKFAANETAFVQARNNYTYRQTVRLQELDSRGNPTGGKWEMVSDIIFSPDGKRSERVVYAPVATLRNIMLTPEDLKDFSDVQPFVLTTSEIANYDVRYLGPEKVDEIGCHVFSVRPKKMMPGKRYFEGQIWVDDRDLEIVKTLGKGVGIVKKDSAFPRFETYREQIDGKYWFPTYTRADDTLHFEDLEQRISLLVRYQDYKHYEGRSTIRFGDVVEDPAAKPEPKK
jgi:hypothetical protein